MRRTSVLVIHADVDAADIMRLRLRVSCACDTSVAHDARQALEALHRRVPDVIVIDVPRRNEEALELVRQLRAADRVGASLLIALTEIGADAQPLRAGCDHHVARPPDMQILRGLIQDVSRSGRPDVS